MEHNYWTSCRYMQAKTYKHCCYPTIIILYYTLASSLLWHLNIAFQSFRQSRYPIYNGRLKNCVRAPSHSSALFIPLYLYLPHLLAIYLEGLGAARQFDFVVNSSAIESGVESSVLFRIMSEVVIRSSLPSIDFLPSMQPTEATSLASAHGGLRMPSQLSIHRPPSHAAIGGCVSTIEFAENSGHSI